MTERTAANRSAPQSERKPPVTLRYVAVGRSSRSLLLFGGNLGMIEEGEQVVANPGVALAQSLAVAIDRCQRHDGIERVFQTAAVFAPRAVGQIAVSPRQHRGAQQQRLHARREHRIASVDGILAIAQLVGEGAVEKLAFDRSGNSSCAHVPRSPADAA